MRLVEIAEIIDVVGSDDCGVIIVTGDDAPVVAEIARCDEEELRERDAQRVVDVAARSGTAKERVIVPTEDFKQERVDIKALRYRRKFE